MYELKPYFIAVAVGLLVGVERENSKVDQRALGVRTFLLLSLLGVIAGEFQNPVLTVLTTAFAFSLIIVSYFIQIYYKPEDIRLGLTTEFAAGIVFIAGLLSHTAPILCATMGPIVAIVLFSKNSLHRFTREIKPTELKAAIIILLIAVAIIDLAPDRAVDSWQIFNPRKFGYLVLTLASLEFASYVLLKITGERRGTLVVGFLGGLVSSTAVLISSSRQAVKAPEYWAPLLCSVIAAQIAALLELTAIVFLVSEDLFLRLLPPIFVGILVALIFLIILMLKKNPVKLEIGVRSPLDLRGVLRLSVIFAMLLSGTTLAKHLIGDSAIITISILSGMFELHGITLANATLFSQKQVSIDVATRSILLAIGASLVTKIIVSWLFTRQKFAIFLTFIFSVILSAILCTAVSSGI